MVTIVHACEHVVTYNLGSVAVGQIGLIIRLLEASTCLEYCERELAGVPDDA